MELELERRRFEKAKGYVRAEMQNIDGRFEDGISAGDEASEESVRQLLQRRWRTLALVMESPYFARIDFDEDARPDTKRLYLGKTTVMDGERNIRVVDWRAPVASLYYENRLGRASYVCPDGEISGELTLKRQFAVSGGGLTGYDDVDITSDDELLRPYLTVASDMRLKNIIATIQSEQNRIIRADLGRHMIVQGVAGSGKTTVALHRIAYFVYTWAERFTPDRFMVLAPNGFFLRYISGVLPDLGVEDAVQTTFEDLVREKTGIKAAVEDSVAGHLAVCLADSEQSRADYGVRAYKSSLEFRGELDAFLADWEKTLLPGGPLVAGGLQLMSAAELAQLYARQAVSLPIFVRLGDIKKQLERATRDHIGARAAIREWLRIPPKSKVIELYKSFLNVQKFKPTWEDLTPLLYICHRLHGAFDRKCRHIIIDEAQDFSLFSLSLLREIYPNASFTIFGDMAQGIFPYRGLDSWESVNEACYGGEAGTAVLKKSYRTTVEIMEAAGSVMRYIPGVEPGEAVVRHGEAVRYVVAVAPKEHKHNITEALERYEAHPNVAVICKSPARCASVSDMLGGAYKVVTSHDERHDGGVCIIPAALSKGLEFDAVIIADAESYTERDARLLYVAMTRAMHSLTVLGLGSLGILQA